MISFQINDMTCNHCVNAISQAIRSIDAQASVTIDLPVHLVQIESSEVDADALVSAIQQAGYSPQRISMAQAI